MTLKTVSLITIIGLIVHIVIQLVGILPHGSLLRLVDLIVFEGGLLFFFTVYYIKQ